MTAENSASSSEIIRCIGNRQISYVLPNFLNILMFFVLDGDAQPLSVIPEKILSYGTNLELYEILPKTTCFLAKMSSCMKI